MKKFLALLLSTMMVLSCFAGMTFTIAADESVDDPVEYEDIVVNLYKGDRTDTPFSSPSDKKMGHRFTATQILKQITVYDLATYADKSENKWTFKIWQWDTDYDTTVAAKPLYAQSGVNHIDNQTFIADIPVDLRIKGDIYYELEYLEGIGGFTGWTASEGKADGVETYVAGALKDSTFKASALLYGGPDPMEFSTDCMFTYDFTKYSENVTADMGLNGQNGVKVKDLTDSGYVTIEALNADPFFCFGTAPNIVSTQGDYIVIKYRTQVPDAGGEFFATRDDGVTPGQPGSNVQFKYNADGNWHTLIVDATEVWGNVENVTLTGMRFDPLQSTGFIDVSYIKFFATLEGAEACVASETKEVTLKGEYVEGNDAIIMVGGQAYSADRWVKLSVGSYTQPATGNFEGDPGKWSICADNVRYFKDGQQTDCCTQEAHLYLMSVESKIKDTEGAYEYISFRGWANPTVPDVTVDQFGYAINDQEPVFNESFKVNEPSLKEAVGAGAERYDNIIVPTAGLADGVYNIYLLVKDTNGVIYNMNGSWGGDIQYVKGNIATGESAYPYEDADGNGYSTRADGVLLDKNGIDTGMRLFTDDEGTPYGVGHYFALTYQDPADGAIEIDGAKYTYTTKLTLTPKMEPVDPEGNPATATYEAVIPHVSCDTLYFGETQMASSEVQNYIAELGGLLRDTDQVLETMTFRGWIGHNESPIDQFGYAFDGGEPVWGDFKEKTEDGVLNAGGGSNSQRFTIKVDISGLTVGKHSLYLLVKFEDGSIMTMNSRWGDLIVVKGGSWKQVGYMEENDTYVINADGTVSINGEAATGKILINDDEAIYYDGISALDDNAKGKYLYDVTFTYTETPEIPVNPAELVPVYLIDGDMLNVYGGNGIDNAEYDYEGGYITYVAIADDPNTHGQNFVPAGTVLGRYLVLKYRTSSEGAQGECFVGIGPAATGPDNVRYPAYITDGEWHTLIADLSVSAAWSDDGVVEHFRNDILIDKGDSIDIEYYAFFNTLKEATYYADNDCHVLPKLPVYYTITFKADGEIVKEIKILEGSTTVKEPAVPEKEGYTGVWEEYTITGDSDQIINAVYTEIIGEPGDDTGDESDTEPGDDTGNEPGDDTGSTDTDPVDTDPVETDPVESDPEDKDPQVSIDVETSTHAAGTDSAEEDGGCASVVASVSLVALLAAACAAVVLKKKED